MAEAEEPYRELIRQRDDNVQRLAVVPQNSPFKASRHVLIRYRPYGRMYPRWAPNEWIVNTYEPGNLNSFVNALLYPTFYNPSHLYLLAAPRMKRSDITCSPFTIGTNGPMQARGGYVVFTHDDEDLTQTILRAARQLQVLYTSHPPPPGHAAHDLGGIPFDESLIRKQMSANHANKVGATRARDTLFVQVTSIVLWMRAMGAYSYDIPAWDHQYNEAVEVVLRQHPYSELIRRNPQYHKSFMGTVFSALSPNDACNRLISSTRIACWDIARWWWKDQGRMNNAWWTSKYLYITGATILTNPQPSGNMFAWSPEAVIMDDVDNQVPDTLAINQRPAVELGWDPYWCFDKAFLDNAPNIPKPRNLQRRQKHEESSGMAVWEDEEDMRDAAEWASVLWDGHNRRMTDGTKAFWRDAVISTNPPAPPTTTVPSREPSPDRPAAAPPGSIPVTRGPIRGPPPSANDRPNDNATKPSGSDWGNTVGAGGWELISARPGDWASASDGLPGPIFYGPDVDKRKESYWHDGPKAPLRRPQRAYGPRNDPYSTRGRGGFRARHEPVQREEPPRQEPPPRPAVRLPDPSRPEDDFMFDPIAALSPDQRPRSLTPEPPVDAPPPVPTSRTPPFEPPAPTSKPSKGKGKARADREPEAREVSAQPQTPPRTYDPPIRRVDVLQPSGQLEERYVVHPDDLNQTAGAGSSGSAVPIPRVSLPRTPAPRRPPPAEPSRPAITSGRELLQRLQDGPSPPLPRIPSVEPDADLAYRPLPPHRLRELDLIRRMYGPDDEIPVPEGITLLDRMSTPPALAHVSPLPPLTTDSSVSVAVSPLGPDPENDGPASSSSLILEPRPEVLGETRFSAIPERFWREMWLLREDDGWRGYVTEQRDRHRSSGLPGNGSTLLQIWRLKVRYNPAWRKVASDWLAELYRRPSSDYLEELTVPWNAPENEVVQEDVDMTADETNDQSEESPSGSGTAQNNDVVMTGLTEDDEREYGMPTREEIRARCTEVVIMDDGDTESHASEGGTTWYMRPGW